MAYSERARALRACRYIHPDGRRCKAWALWDIGQREAAARLWKALAGVGVRNRE